MLLFASFLLLIFMFAMTNIFVDYYMFAYLDWFLDIISLILVLIPILFFLFTTESGKIINEYIKSSFKKNYKYSKIELESISTAIKNTIKITLASGIFNFTTGIVLTLVSHTTNFEDYDGFLRFCQSMAANLMCFIYSIAIGYFLFFPVQAWAENKINKLQNKIK